MAAQISLKGDASLLKLRKSILPDVNKSSAAKMCDSLTTIDMDPKWGGAAVEALGPHWVTI